MTFTYNMHQSTLYILTDERYMHVTCSSQNKTP